jgi:hypothetical protein
VPDTAIPPGSANPLWPGVDVHAVAVEVALVVDHVAQVDPDAEADAAFLADRLLTLLDAALNPDGALDGVDGAGELAEGTIARELDETAAVLGQERLDELLAVRLEPPERAGFVPLHQARVADHVRGEDRGEPAVDTVRGDGAALRHDPILNLSPIWCPGHAGLPAAS